MRDAAEEYQALIATQGCSMGAQVAYSLAILTLNYCRVFAQSLGSAAAMAPALGAEALPTVVIQSQKPLPRLAVLQDRYTLSIAAARIIGPGNKGGSDHPYVEYTGRLYNGQLTAGVVRGMQGSVHTYAKACYDNLLLHHQSVFRGIKTHLPCSAPALPILVLVVQLSLKAGVSGLLQSF